MRLFSFLPFRRIAVVAAVAGITGCTDFSTSPDILGRVTVTVVDQANVGVPNLVVDLLMPDRITVWRSLRTSSNGTGEFGTRDGGVIAATYYVRLDPGVNYTLAPDESNDRVVAVQVGEVYPFTFKVVRRQGPG